jgi:hypothetical protein
MLSPFGCLTSFPAKYQPQNHENHPEARDESNDEYGIDHRHSQAPDEQPEQLVQTWHSQ